MLRTLFFFLLCLTVISGFTQPVSKNAFLLGHWDDENVPDNGGGAKYNEVWGFEINGREYGVIGSTLGTHIIELGAQGNLVEKALIAGRRQGAGIVHRDYHEYKGYLYAVADQGPASLQIIDLHNLPGSASVVYDSDSLVNTAHNVFIDSATAKMYILGPAGFAMSVYSIQNPEEPIFLSHFTEVDYIHDAFIRNDTAYLNCANQGLWIYDFSDALNPQAIGAMPFYPDQGYCHSGWLSKDGKTYVFADETEGMRMKVCDVSNLLDIEVLSLFNSEVSANTVPHNLILLDTLVYVSHYNDGLRIFNIADRENPEQIGYYDTYLEESTSNFRGAWGVYPLLPSGRILISDRQTGLYMFKYVPPPPIEEGTSIGFYPNPFTNETALYYENKYDLTFELKLFDATGKQVYASGPNQQDFIRLYRDGLASGMYFYEYRGIKNSFLETGVLIAE